MRTSLITAVKNMDRPTVERYFDSVHKQNKIGDVIIVDYGSTNDNLSWERELFKGIKLVEVERDTDIWREGRAYNIGIRMATTDFIVSTPIDIVLGQNFIESVDDALCSLENALILCLRIDLDNMGNRIGYAPDCNFGTCIGVSKSWMEKVHGFDEQYAGWGRYDMDLVYRARSDGLSWRWIQDKTEIVHPWHKFRDAGYVKENDDYYRSATGIVRNMNGWGEL